MRVRRLGRRPEREAVLDAVVVGNRTTGLERRGVDAGADAYLVKGELGVESLAQAIDRLV